MTDDMNGSMHTAKYDTEDMPKWLCKYVYPTCINGARGGVVVKALRYKPTGRGFDSRCVGIFQ